MPPENKPVHKPEDKLDSKPGSDLDTKPGHKLDTEPGHGLFAKPSEHRLDHKPHHKPAAKPAPADLKENQLKRAHNTPQNAQASVTRAREVLAALVPGRLWRHVAPRGEFEIKGVLLLDSEPVCVLHFNPEDGSVLPRGLHALSEGNPDVISLIESRLQEVHQQLLVLDGAEFREPDCCWVVPLAHRGRIVAHLKVSADGTKVLPDRKAHEEMSRLAE